GTGAVISDLAGFPFVMRGKDYSVLDRPEVQSRLHLPAEGQFSRAESGLVRQLYDCPDVAVGPEGVRCRVVVAPHPAASKQSRRRCARPSLLSPSKNPHPSKRLCRAMRSLRSPCPGKRGVSRGRTSLSSLTGCCCARLARRCARRSSAVKSMAVCACSTAPGSLIVAAAQCV